jgi:hypothetical protein
MVFVLDMAKYEYLYWQYNSYLAIGGKMDKDSNATKIFKIIFKKKVITIDALPSLLNSSIKTARRRLKLWEAYTSYNQNGGYYTLPNIPEFDENGLWAYRKIHFSKYGNLKQTTINLIKRSKAGLDAAEMNDLEKNSRALCLLFCSRGRLHQTKRLPCRYD